MVENQFLPLSLSFLERGKSLRSLIPTAIDELQRHSILVKVIIEIEEREMNIP